MSHLYSLSFAPNPDWSRDFAGQEEILVCIVLLIIAFSYFNLVIGLPFGCCGEVWTFQTYQIQQYC